MLRPRRKTSGLMAQAGRFLRTAQNRRSSRPFSFRGCDLTAECLPATEEVRVQFPAAAPVHFRFRIYDIRFAQGRPRASLRSRVSKTQPVWGSTTAACQNHKSRIVNHKFCKGAWQKSDAPALQAGPNGSVTRRPPPFYPTTDVGAHCGELDQSTERSLINFFRRV